jgi:hypothetical protein
MFSTYIISLIFTFILFLILLFGKRYYDGIGLTKIEEEEEEEDELSVKYYNNTNKDVRGSYFSDEVIDCEETIESSDTCVEIGQDLVTILQYPMNGGKKCTDKICKNSDIYNCETTRGRKPGVFIQKRSDNKFLNIDLIPCADESSFVLEDGYVYDPPISQEEIDKMTCKDTDIERITVKNSEGEDMSWDVILKWEDFDVSGFATLWKLEVTQVSSGRDRFNLHTILKDSTLGIYKKIYLVPKDNNYARQLNRWQIALSYDESAFHEHSQWSDGVNLICEKDNTQLIVYKPVLTACVSITGFNSKSKIKRNSDGKYLVISGPKLLKYYEDRANAENYEFQKVYDETTNNPFYFTTDIDNRTSKHQFCFGGDNDHVSYTTNADDATIFIINKEGGNLKIKLEFDVTNFNITQGTTEIGSYESPHTVTKYIELLENGDLSLCDNYKNFNKVIKPESDIGAFGEIVNFGSGWLGGRIYNQYTPYQSDKITVLTDNDIYDGQTVDGKFRTCDVYKTDTKCFYGSSEPIVNSYSVFIEKYELVNIEKDDYTRQGSTDNNNCSNDVSDEKKACQIDYKKCISYDDFFSYHGNMSEFVGGDFEITTDYSFGKCVPKTQFMDKISETNTDGNLKWSSEFTDIVTRKCDQIIECDEGMESSLLFNAADEQKQQGHMIKQFMDKNYPDNDFDDLPVNTKGPVYEIVRKFQDDEMKPITYSQACTIKTE